MRLILYIFAILLAILPIGHVQAAERLPERFHAPVSERLDQRLFDEAVLFFSNQARREHGRAPLAADPRLAAAASEHARNMARLRTHSHELPVRGQAHLKQRMKSQAVSYRLAAENIAKDKVYRLLGRPIAMSSRGCQFSYADTREPVPVHTYASVAREVVSRWLASPKHRASLLSPKFQRLGSGIGIDPAGPACGDLYLVQDFAD